MHDSAPCHKTARSLIFLEIDVISVLDWPPYSSDLKVIENHFGIFKSKLEKLTPTTSIEELKDIALHFGKILMQIYELVYVPALKNACKIFENKS